MVLTPATRADDPSWIKKVGRGAEDTVLSPFRIGGAVGNGILVNGVYVTVGNLLTRGQNAVAKTAATLVDNFTYKPYDYEAFEHILADDKFSQRWSKRFGNTWKTIKNTGRFTGNTFRQVVIGSVLAVPTLAGGVISATVGNALHGVKDLTNAVAGIIKDSADSLITIADQSKKKSIFGFEKVEKTEHVHYADVKASRLAKRAAKRAARTARRAAIRAARRGVPPPAPAASTPPASTPPAAAA